MKSEIKKFFRGEVEDDEATREKYSRDASLLEVKPALVAYPFDSEDVKNLVKWVGENKEKYPGLAITPRCAGTDMSGGAIGESIILDFTRHMNRLIGGPLPHDENSWSITVEPGMLYRDFEQLTLAKGYILPCYTASKSINAVGGMFGNNSAGERTLKYGKTEDYILETKIVFADGSEHVVRPLSEVPLKQKISQVDFEGNVYRKVFDLVKNNEEEIKHAKPQVHKNSAGYYIWNVLSPQGFDLNKLLVGSQGTLGIATELTFKLLPNPKYSKLVSIFIDDLESLGRLVNEILELNPETLEAYDDKTMRLAVKFFPDFLKKKGLRGMFKLVRSFLPEFKMLIRGGMPKLVILVEFSGVDEKDAHNKCHDLAEKIKHFGFNIHITESEAESEKYWDIRRESFALLRKHVRTMRTAPFIDDIIVRPEFLPKFLPELNAILKNYKLIYTIAGHAGDGNFHIIPLMDFRRRDVAKIILELSDLVYDLVVRYHGSITAEHNDGIIRTPYLHKMYTSRMIEIFKEIKYIFDPKNILNPGKKVPTADMGGTKDYIASHLVKEHDMRHTV